MTLVLPVLLGVLVSQPVVAAPCRRACTGQVATCRRDECGGLAARERHRCIRACRARSTCTAPGAPLRTLAYVTNVCEEKPGGTILRQQVFVRRGNCAPVMLLEFPAAVPALDPGRVCNILGSFRNGFGSTALGVVQRFSVLPDASALVVEVNDAHSLYPPVTPRPPERGIFLVRADGRGTRRLGDPSRIPLIVAEGGSFRLNDNSFFAVSPDGRTIGFSDLLPGPDTAESRQLVVIDVPTGRRTQLTRIPGPIYGSTFLDNGRLLFYAGDPTEVFTVKPDGSELRQLPRVVAIEGSQVQPVFGLSGGGGNVVNVRLPGVPRRTYSSLPNIIVESFLIDGDDVLQLTSFGYPDTVGVSGRDRAFISASADPFGTNPTGDCQLFSVGRLGEGLRQLTAFNDADRIQGGCNVATPPGTACTVIGLAQDQVTGVVGFASSCNPVGRNPYGFQVFSVRPDGSGLRQVTDARGLETLPDGRVRVELPGPIAYSALLAR